MAKYILSAPSGSGKTTLLNMLSEKRKFILWKSYTTRQPRGPKCYDEYEFCTHQEFTELEKSGFFEETEEVFGNFYGTPKLPQNDDNHIICNVDVLGALKLMQKINKPISIFVFAPIEELRNRLIQRGTHDLETRLSRFNNEISYYSNFQYFIENIDLDESIEYLTNIFDQQFSQKFLDYQNMIVSKLHTYL